MNAEIEILIGDITKIKVDAIVNAANNSLLGGGGVDGAIHKAAGKQLLEECRLLNGCKTGEAKITKGYNLPAKFVIHAVGPIWKGGNNNEEYYLQSAYGNVLEIAKNNNIKSIAFPAISTGIYGYPINFATEIAITTVYKYLENDTNFAKIIFVCFNDYIYNIYSQINNQIKERYGILY
jgi:O-acetyl-ADP-ribose deacetylase (regulator of RNase III)